MCVEMSNCRYVPTIWNSGHHKLVASMEPERKNSGLITRFRNA